MTSSLFGIYNTQRALLMNQAAINIVNSNISNMNTEGYSKQRLEVSQSVKAGKNSGSLLEASQSGLGAYIDTISRNRDAYIDSYYRKESTKLNYYSELHNNNLIVEDITNELSDTGVNKVLNDFYTVANQLSANPTDSVARTDFAQKAESVTLKLNGLYDQLNNYASSIAGVSSNPSTFDESRMGTEVTSLNTKLQNLTDLNNTIISSSSQNITPNGLLDQRDKLLDDISKSIPITIKQTPGNLVIVSLEGNDLVSGNKFMSKFVYDNKDPLGNDTTNAPVLKLKQVNEPKNILRQNVNGLVNSGKIGALLDLTSTDTTKPNSINGILEKLNVLARNFAKEINDIQVSKQPDTVSLAIAKNKIPSELIKATESIFTSSDSIAASEMVGAIPDYSHLTAGNIKINSAILNDPFKIAAATLKLNAVDPNKAPYDVAKTTFTAAKATYDGIVGTPTPAQQTTYDKALSAFDTAKTTYKSAADTDAYNTAKTTFNAIATPTPMDIATYNTAKTTYKSAYDADTYNTAKTAFTNAKATYDAIPAPSLTQQTTYDTALSAFNTAKDDYTNLLLPNIKTQTGDGSNALLLSQLRNKSLTGINSLNGSTTEQYVNSIMGNFGVQTGTVKDKLDSQTSVVDQVKQKRETAIGVNLDEELTDLVKYQRAYEASSRVFNVVNQMLQQIINLGK